MINEEQFIEMTGLSPTNDDLDRCNCKLIGEVGHSLCGICLVHNQPRFFCGCENDIIMINKASMTTPFGRNIIQTSCKGWTERKDREEEEIPANTCLAQSALGNPVALCPTCNTFYSFLKGRWLLYPKSAE